MAANGDKQATKMEIEAPSANGTKKSENQMAKVTEAIAQAEPLAKVRVVALHLNLQRQHVGGC